MARRGENIHKRKDGRWEGRYIKGRSETGKAIWGYVYAYSYVDAKSALIRKKVKAADYTVPLGAQELTISVLSELWLSTLNDLEDSSIAHYRYSIEHYILPVIGNLRISQLSRAKLELCVLQIISPVGGEHKPFGTSLSRECISLVRRLCKYAYTLHLMPMIELSIKPVKETSEFSEALSLEEQAAVSRFVFKNPTPRKAGILFMLQLGLRIVNLDVVFAKAHCIRRNGIPKILSQSGAVVKIKLEVRFLSDAEKVVQHFQPGVVIQRTDFAANVGQLAQHIPLHLIQPFAGILAVLLVGGENQVLLLLHIADFFRIGFHQTIAFDAVCVETIIGAVVQNISLKGNLVHALADNAKLRPAVGRNIRINPAHLCQNVLLFIVALHGIVDVGDTPHLAVHLAGAPSAVRIDFINRDRFLHRSRDFVAAPRSACGGIFI